MASASLLHARCGYSPRFSCSSTRRNGGGALGSSPSCCSSSYLAFSSGAYNSSRNQGLRAHAMTSQGGFASSSRGVASAEKKPDHLLVLVHGILASPSDWTYVEAELRKRLGRNFLIYGKLILLCFKYVELTFSLC